MLFIEDATNGFIMGKMGMNDIIIMDRTDIKLIFYVINCAHIRYTAINTN